MASETVKNQDTVEGERPSGVPAPHQLGASRREGLYAVLALVVMAAIVYSFWFEASR